MKSSKFGVLLIVASFGLITGFGLGDLQNAIPGNTDDCSKKADPKKCERNKKMETATKAVIVGAAIKLIADMIVEYRTAQTKGEDQVVTDYKKQHNTLPAEPQVTEYNSKVKPGEVVNAGKEVLVSSSLVVIPGEKTKTLDIKEQLTIYDAENNANALKSLTKPVNEKTKKSGAFSNEFKFTLPVGLPQGVYPIKSEVLVDGKAAKPVNNKMQLVLNVDESNQYHIVALNQ